MRIVKIRITLAQIPLPKTVYITVFKAWFTFRSEALPEHILTPELSTMFTVLAHLLVKEELTMTYTGIKTLLIPSIFQVLIFKGKAMNKNRLTVAEAKSIPLIKKLNHAKNAVPLHEILFKLVTSGIVI